MLMTTTTNVPTGQRKVLQAYRRKFEIEPLLREKPTQEEELLQNTRTRATVSPLQLSTMHTLHLLPFASGMCTCCRLPLYCNFNPLPSPCFCAADERGMPKMPTSGLRILHDAAAIC